METWLILFIAICVIFTPIQLGIVAFRQRLGQPMFIASLAVVGFIETALLLAVVFLMGPMSG